jgi:hypothetical protein
MPQLMSGVTSDTIEELRATYPTVIDWAVFILS